MQSRRNITGLQNGYSCPTFCQKDNFLTVWNQVAWQNWEFPNGKLRYFWYAYVFGKFTVFVSFFLYILTGYWICIGHLNSKTLLDQEVFGPGNRCSLTTDSNNIVIFSATNNATVGSKHSPRKLLNCLYTTMEVCKHISRGRHSEIA